MPLPPHRILFISYSHAWDAWSLQLYRAIFDTKLYFPFRDDRIPKTADWWQSLCLNIETSVAMVAMLTPEYVQSIYCMGELDYALALNKPVVPIMLNLPSAQYPQQLARRNIQFITADTAWSEQAMRENILSAMNQVLLDYAAGKYPNSDADFLARRETARPPVPVPAAAASPQDQQIRQQMQTPAVHVAKAAQDATALIKQYYEQKQSDPFSAGNLLTQLSQRDDLPFYFHVAEEREELQVELDRVKLRLQQQAQQARLDKEYAELEIVVTHQKPARARKIVLDWLAKTGYPDHQGYLRRLPTPPADLLPAPFGWVDIPAGNVTLVNTWDNNPTYVGKKGEQKTFDVPAFAIAKYPVTNAQFRLFVEAGGYSERKWWTAAGWQQRESENWTEPRYWNDAQWNSDMQPVVGVSWYEAVAFCLWLSAQSGEQIMLPTEQQWQRAAQGDDGRAYPWGSDWDCQRCNNSVSPCDSSATTPVTQYAGRHKGDSFFGVVDMAGNVWEWCLTAYASGETGLDGTDVRVLRGGSWWNGDTDGFRCDSRDGGIPHNWNHGRGFRLALS